MPLTLFANSVATTDRRPSPLLSNNPFRNRTGSGPTSPAFPTPANGTSATNPFLDPRESTMAPAQTVNTVPGGGKTSPAKTNATESTTELFDDLDINDKSASPRRGLQHVNGYSGRPENIPPKKLPNGLSRMPPPGHRPSYSEEEKRRNANKPRGPGGLDIFADPPDPNSLRERKPRRNSESSLREKKLPDTEEERRREERRRRHEKRKPKQPAHRLDIIDKLDVTSIYGMGCEYHTSLNLQVQLLTFAVFHHDGPFDACNPARNRKNAKQAPMQAFPKDSRNMNLGGSGPNNSKLNLDLIHGTGHEANNEYGNDAPAYDEDAAYMRPKTSGQTAPFMDPTSRVEPLHGEETIGLGTSTFLEGAPASRAAIQRRESEFEAQQRLEMAGGLSRKKSLAQKIGAVRRPREARQATSPEPTTPLGTGKSESQANPFFKEYDQEYDRKGQQIAFAQQQDQQIGGRARAPSSPKRAMGLERTKTTESIGEGGESKGGRFLSRVKSIKTKASRTRPERRDTSG